MQVCEMAEGVRRRLFQDEDPVAGTGGSGGRGRGSEPGAGEGENITNSLLEQIKLEQEAARDRWNFDFEKEEPLPGRWEWVRKGESRFENFGEDQDEYFLAREQPEAPDQDSNHSDVFLDAHASMTLAQDDPGQETQRPSENDSRAEDSGPMR